MPLDITSDVLPVSMIGPASLNADNTPAAFSLSGFASASLDIGVGVGGITFDTTNKIEFKLTRTVDGVTYAAVTDDDVFIVLPDGTRALVGSDGIVRSLTAAHAAASITRVGFKRVYAAYKLLADFSGTHGTATPMHCVLRKGQAYVGPA